MDILRTKLYMPPLRPNMVVRPRLLQQLEDGVQHGRFLTLVSAPAGYGKTTLIAAWRQQNQHAESGGKPESGSWLSLDDEDNDPLRFFAYLLAALRESGLNLETTSKYLSGLSQPPAIPNFMTTLLIDIEQAANGRSLVLVLDDYHKIQTATIHDALQFLLDHVPPNLHLVLITREDPPLTLARWRVGNRMTEIRASDLRFTPAEAVDFFNQTMGLSLASADIAALEQRTEGWAAGLQLAAIAAQGRADAADFIATFSGSHQYVIDYLVEEVLRLQDESVRTFLRETAVLNRFTASLCDAVTGRSDSQAVLAELERNHLFLVPLDNQRYWYRYHNLLADSLRVGLDKERQAASHRRAAAWFADQRLFPEAIDHAAAAGDTAEVARLIRLAAEPAFQKGQIRQIAAWLKRLPQDLIVQDPEFGIFWVLALILTGRSQEAPAAVALLEKHQADWDNPCQKGRLLAIKAWVADITSSSQRAELPYQAVEAINEDDTLFRAFVTVPLGHVHLQQGRLQDAIKIFEEGLELIRWQGDTFVRLSLAANLIHTLNHAGRRLQAWSLCQLIIADFVDANGKPLPPVGLPYLLSAWLHYDADRLERARQDLATGRDLMQQAFKETMLTPLEIELPVLLHMAAGDLQQAQMGVQAGIDRAATQKYQFGVDSGKRIAAELNLRQGEVTAVRRWVDALSLPAAPSTDSARPKLYPHHDAVYLVYIRLLLAEERQEEAASWLKPLEKSARDGERGRSLITILLLQAVVNEDAFPYLQEAVERAAAGQYLRLIVDECAWPGHGERLRRLLRREAVRMPNTSFVNTMLGALPDEKTGVPETAVTQSAKVPQLLESLTEQEQVIVQLLATGKSNREIADELVITLGTAKWHVHNIYQKLDVGSRAEAVARIHEWQLLDR